MNFSFIYTNNPILYTQIYLIYKGLVVKEIN